MRRPAAIVLFAAAVFAAVGGHADAASPSRRGWWKTGLPIADLGIGGVGDLRDPQGLDVPDGGLLVQGGPSVDQPAAYAAVAFDLGTATVAGPLRLVVAPNTPSVPGSRLIACPLDDPSFRPAEGGSLADGPKYTCTSAVNATVDQAGAYVFDVAGLRRGDALAIAILPSVPTDRVVFSPPGDDTLPVTESTGGDAAAGTPLEPVPDAAPTEGIAPPLADLGPVAGFDSPAAAPPASDVPVPQSGPASANVLPAARPATAAHSSRASYMPYVVVPLLALAAVLWLGAGQEQ